MSACMCIYIYIYIYIYTDTLQFANIEHLSNRRDTLTNKCCN